MDISKLVLNTDFLLFIFGVYWTDIAGYIQTVIATCNSKIFGLTLAIIFYVYLKSIVSK